MRAVRVNVNRLSKTREPSARQRETGSLDVRHKTREDRAAVVIRLSVAIAQVILGHDAARNMAVAKETEIGVGDGGWYC